MLNRRRGPIPATVSMLDFVFPESQVLVSPSCSLMYHRQLVFAARDQLPSDSPQLCYLLRSTAADEKPAEALYFVCMLLCLFLLNFHSIVSLLGSIPIPHDLQEYERMILPFQQTSVFRMSPSEGQSSHRRTSTSLF
jgi:hypothetical protein